MAKSRVFNSARNIVFFIGRKVLQILLIFVFRTVIIKTIGADVLGLEGLFDSILQVLNMAELGITSAIMVSLYKPLAENDEEKIAAILSFFNKFYFAIGIAIGVVGVALLPLLPFLIKLPENTLNINLIYILTLLSTCTSYFYAGRTIIFEADQKSYKTTTINSIAMIISQIAQIAIILITKNYILALIVRIVSNLSLNLFIYFYAKKDYPLLNKFKSSKLSKIDKKELFADSRAVMCHKIGGVMVFGTDNIIISMFISTLVTGAYGNYSLITTSVVFLTTILMTALIPSIGNLKQESNNIDYHYKIFGMVNMVSFISVSIASIILFCVVNPFITAWIGVDWLFEIKVVFIIVINFYLSCTRNGINSFLSAAGYFRQTMWKPILESVINLVVSLATVKYLGITGVFLGTTASIVLGSLWVDPVIVYKYWFKKSPLPYFVDYLYKFIVCIAVGAFTYYLTSLILVENLWLSFLLKFIVSSVVSSLLIILSIVWRKEFKNLFVKIKILLNIKSKPKDISN